MFNYLSTVEGVSLDRKALTVAKGEKASLKASVTPPGVANRNVSWKSGNDGIATVSKDGVVTGVKAGTATITVTTEDGGKSAECVVTVRNPDLKVESVSLDRKSLSVVKGKTAALKAAVLPANATTRTVTWKSSNTKVATVSAAGVVTGVKAGTATITATTEDGKKTAKCGVAVANPTVKVKKVTLAGKASVAKGKTAALKASITPANATNKALTWKSSNTKVATVSQKGVVKGVKAGTAKVTVSTKDGGKTATYTVTVTNPVVKVKSVKINKKSASVKKGKQLSLKATVSPANATNKGVTWKSKNKKIATVSSKGVVKGVKKGKTTVTVTTKDGKKSYSCAITVK